MKTISCKKKAAKSAERQTANHQDLANIVRNDLPSGRFPFPWTDSPTTNRTNKTTGLCAPTRLWINER